MNVRPEFKVHMLNESGKQKAHAIAQAFSELLDKLDGIIAPSRNTSLAKTHLETASYFAKRAMAEQPENQE